MHAVDGLSFDLAPGRATGLVGPNGAGKSTALKLIAGAVPPSSGAVLVDGVDVAGWPAHKVARIIVKQRAREAMAISHRAYVMAAGRVVLTDRADALLARSDLGEVFLGRSG